MIEKNKKNKEAILEPYLEQINALLEQMAFHYFENDKKYSFDYHLKSKFDEVISNVQDELQQSKLPMSPTFSNKLPIFLPKETSRIAFFSYQAKSVRAIDPENLVSILTKQAIKRSKVGEFPYAEVENLVHSDLQAFKEYHNEHNFSEYRIDVFTSTVQFNAYDKQDNLLIEKSFVKGGLVFDMIMEDFTHKVTISYPRYRKQRTDKKDNYLPLRIMKIRGLKTSKS